MTAIGFPLGSHPGARGHESAGRLINAFAEPLGPGAPGAAVLKSIAGLLQFTSATADDNTALTGYRGSMLSGNNLYIAFKDVLVYTTVAGGVPVMIDTLTGEGPVYFARNNKAPTPDLTVVTELGWFSFDTSAVTEIVDADLPSPSTICFQDGYFFISAGKLCFASGINAVTIGALDVTTAEAKPDTIVRVVSYAQNLLIMGSSSIEVFVNRANPEGFPFSRVAVIDRGLAGPRAVAGFEEGFGKALAWVGDDNAVHVLDGYQATRISTPDVDRAIEAVANKSTLEMCAYIDGGHAWISLSSPSWTWEHNLTTQEWIERRSVLNDGTELANWRATGNTCFAFGKWLIGDTLSGKIFQITGNTRREDGNPLIWHVESVPSVVFPNRQFIARADFNFATGTGVATGVDPIETTPRCSISWSDDGGLHWSNPLFREIGRQGQAPSVFVTRTGLTGKLGRRWRLRVADPVYVGLMGGDQNDEARAA